jgi:HEAT repeat protein
MRFLLIVSSLVLYSTLLLGEENEPGSLIQTEGSNVRAIQSGLNRSYIAYLMQSKEFDKALGMYQKFRKTSKQHDFETLEQIALSLLDQGAHSSDSKERLLSMFGSAVASTPFPMEVLESGLSNSDPQTQMASIFFLNQMQDDRSDELLTKALSSEFLLVRMEAAYHLAVRKHKKATGLIEALMFKLPPQLHAYFPQFFALIGNLDATLVLRKLMDDRNLSVRIEAILNAARHQRDDLISIIRSAATHSNVAEQEACASALGMLKDSKSIGRLKKLATSPAPNVQIAADFSLHILGDGQARNRIAELAKTNNLFAITLLGDIEGSEEVLIPLLRHEDQQVRFNAALAVLKRRSSLSLPILCEILIKDSRDLGVQPQFSLGKSLTAWKIIGSQKQHAKESFYDLQTLSLNIREQILRDCLELPEKDFLKVAALIFEHKQIDLIPLLVNLLENLQTKEALTLLEQNALAAGLPLVRTYCNLALFRLKHPGHHEHSLKEWIKQKQETEMIQFRPLIPWNLRPADAPASSFELTPDESSRLLIEAYEALADRHDLEGIDCIIQGIRKGNPQNRYVLAGLLMRAIQ